jgi:hypothetical protein
MWSSKQAKRAFVLCTLGVVGALALACSGSSDHRDAEPTRIISLGGRPAKTALDAGELSRQIFTGCPPWCGSQIDEIEFVETTVGQARRFFGTGGEKVGDDPGDYLGSSNTPDGWPDDLKVWFVIAHGTFHETHVAIRSLPPPVSNLWAIVAYGGHTSYFATDDEYDLSQLGRIRHIELPLPPYPTPVRLDQRT